MSTKPFILSTFSLPLHFVKKCTIYPQVFQKLDGGGKYAIINTESKGSVDKVNKWNKILLGILAFIVVCVVGYALFGETITVTGTATAKGNMSLTTTKLTDEEIKAYSGEVDTGIIKSSNIDITGNTITTSATLGMPGSSKHFGIKVENTGTIPVYLKSVTDENGNPAETSGGSSFASKHLYNSDKTTALIATIYPDCNYMEDYNSEPWGIDGVVTIEELSEYVLDPGETTYYYIEYTWPKPSTSQEEISLSFTVNLNWEQVTTN